MLLKPLFAVYPDTSLELLCIHTLPFVVCYASGVIVMDEFRSAAVAAGFSALMADAQALERFLDAFPYPVQIFLPDGTLAKVNPAFLREFQVNDATSIVGLYNVRSDPTVEAHGVLENVRRMFAGETLFIQDVHIPMRALKEGLGLPVASHELVFEDVTSFCVGDAQGKPLYFVNVYLARRKYHERAEISRAVSYIEQNWREPFSIERIASAVNLSPSYYRKLFHEHTGVTPHEYYANFKIEKIKEALLNADFTVEQAFEACGIVYHGYYARLFQERTGYSPSAYRKLAKNKAVARV